MNERRRIRGCHTALHSANVGYFCCLAVGSAWPVQEAFVWHYFRPGAESPGFRRRYRKLRFESRALLAYHSFWLFVRCTRSALLSAASDVQGTASKHSESVQVNWCTLPVAHAAPTPGPYSGSSATFPERFQANALLSPSSCLLLSSSLPHCKLFIYPSKKSSTAIKEVA